ncbi:MAG TPA: DUF6496 domain-containing protein [Bryobacteraceae bacterium]|jgi:hypothetical protein
MATKKKSTTKSKRVTRKKVGKVMHEYKHKQLSSGRSGKKVKSRKQAIAIGLSEARRAGANVPKKKSASKKKTASKKSTAKKTTAKKKRSAKKTSR